MNRRPPRGADDSDFARGLGRAAAGPAPGRRRARPGPPGPAAAGRGPGPGPDPGAAGARARAVTARGINYGWGHRDRAIIPPPQDKDKSQPLYCYRDILLQYPKSMISDIVDIPQYPFLNLFLRPLLFLLSLRAPTEFKLARSYIPLVWYFRCTCQIGHRR